MRKIALALAAAAAFATPAIAADITIAVTAIVQHPALDAARDGIKEGLAAAGFGDDKIKFVYQSAQGQPATAAQIARQFVGDGATIIVPISTPSAQAAVAATKDIPIVFTAVTDPVGAELVASLDKPGANVTGMSDLSPLADHIALMKEITPNVKKIGVVYNPGEANSVTLITQAEGTGRPGRARNRRVAGDQVRRRPAGDAGARRQGRRDLHPDRQHRRLGARRRRRRRRGEQDPALCRRHRQRQARRHRHRRLQLSRRRPADRQDHRPCPQRREAGRHSRHQCERHRPLRQPRRGRQDGRDHPGCGRQARQHRGAVVGGGCRGARPLPGERAPRLSERSELFGAEGEGQGGFMRTTHGRQPAELRNPHPFG